MFAIPHLSPGNPIRFFGPGGIRGRRISGNPGNTGRDSCSRYGHTDGPFHGTPGSADSYFLEVTGAGHCRVFENMMDHKCTGMCTNRGF